MWMCGIISCQVNRSCAELKVCLAKPNLNWILNLECWETPKHCFLWFSRHLWALSAVSEQAITMIVRSLCMIDFLCSCIHDFYVYFLSHVLIGTAWHDCCIGWHNRFTRCNHGLIGVLSPQSVGVECCTQGDRPRWMRASDLRSCNSPNVILEDELPISCTTNVPDNRTR